MYNQTAVAKPRDISLYHLVAELLDSYGRVKKEHRNCFINAVPATMVVNSQLIGPLLADLFSIIAHNPGREPVYITATGEGNAVRLLVREQAGSLHCFAGSMAA